jgi:hypothetical protein
LIETTEHARDSGDKRESTSEVLHIAEHLNGLPDGIEALDFRRCNHAHHLEGSEGEGKD